MWQNRACGLYLIKPVSRTSFISPKGLIRPSPQTNNKKKIMSKQSFKQMLHASFKSKDTEEWLDVYFTRPIGLVFALMWKALGVHPNVVTVIGIVLGVLAAWLFSYVDIWYNVAAVVLFMFSNFCDSTDGQLARLTGQKTLLGRVLDGFAADVVFFFVYFFLCLRMMGQPIPGTDMLWGVWIWVLAFAAGIMSHSPQCAISDYYRQIHLYFLLGKEGSELDSARQQRAIYESLPKSRWFARAYYFNYANYCKGQERRTPAFQRMKREVAGRYGSLDNMPDHLRRMFLDGSRPLMKYTNILTFNVRAIALYIGCLTDMPWAYLLFEIVVMNIISTYMHRTHERLCKSIIKKLDD